MCPGRWVEVDSTPLLFPTLIVYAVVAIEWHSSRRIAFAALFAAFVLTVACMHYPGLSATEIVAYGEDLLAAPLTLARAVGAGCFLYSVVRLIRTSGIPW